MGAPHLRGVLKTTEIDDQRELLTPLLCGGPGTPGDGWL